MRNDKLLLVYAMQNGSRVDTSFATNCVQDTTTIVEVVDTTEINEGPAEDNSKAGKTKPTRVITWTRVPGSEFCDDLTECVQVYSERNNLGQIRERRIENCADCGAAKK